MKSRALGTGSPLVSAMGYGAWGLSGEYGPVDDEGGMATIRRALELGVTHIDTADQYGHGHNEELVGRAIADRRDDVLLATKFGFVRDARGQISVCGRPDYVREALEASLRRLDVSHVDLYYLHRLDRETPIEETVGAMAELVHAGLIRYIGLSEVGPATIARAQAVHPIAAVQSEYSLWARDVEFDVLPELRNDGISLVAFSPLGRGFLAGAVTSSHQLSPGDYRAQLPRFEQQNLERNRILVDSLAACAAARGISAAQLSLAWLLHPGDDVLAVPGTRRLGHVETNAAAADVSLDADALRKLDELFASDAIAGDRYPPALDHYIDR